MNDLNYIKFSKHAVKRMQQRGIKKETVLFIMAEADREIIAGNGCIAQYISRSHIAYLVKRRLIAPGMAGLARDIVIITEGWTIVTLYHDGGRGPISKLNNRHARKHKSRFSKYTKACQESLHG